MSTPLLESATGEPVRTAWRAAFQTARAVPATSGFVDFRTNGGGPAIEPTTNPREQLDTSGEDLSELDGKDNFTADALEIGNVSVTNKGLQYAIANLIGKYHVTNVGSGSYYRYLAGRDQDTAAGDYMTFLEDSNVVPRRRLRDAMVNALTVSAKPGGNLTANFSFMFGGWDLFGDGTQTAGSGSSIPAISGFYPEQMNALDATDKELLVLIPSVSSKTAKARLGAGSYGSITSTWAYDQYTGLVDDTGLLIGKTANQASIRFPTGATLTDADEFTFPKRRPAWTPSYAADQLIPAINAKCYINGSYTRMEGGFDMKLTRPGVQAVPDLFGSQSATVRDASGIRRGEVSIAREVLDLDLQIALINKATVSFVIDARVDAVIGSSVRQYRYLFAFPEMKLQGRWFKTDAGGQNRQEQFTLRAQKPSSSLSYDGLTFSNGINVLWETNTSSL